MRGNRCKVKEKASSVASAFVCRELLSSQTINASSSKARKPFKSPYFSLGHLALDGFHAKPAEEAGVYGKKTCKGTPLCGPKPCQLFCSRGESEGGALHICNSKPKVDR